ncbi:MCE family protein [Nocardia nova]|uniref:MlaD family protein n=1 Tax=Nocardia nova TaxID=37330 RepID=UPI0025B22001|nr:MlaD family protein [Nocardia nova]MDN2495454.1 MCE family protein [Nocardia nova]
MQRALRNPAVRSSTVAALVRRIRRDEKLLGGLVVIVVVIALAATAVLYVHPTGRKAIVFETTDAAAVRGGEDVRVAGISVGEVTKISLEPATVRVEAEIADNTFVGADSRVEVRMLTPVGGYYVTLVPIGNTALGDTVIPVDRVEIPYSIADLLQAAPHITDNVNGSTIQDNLAQVADGLAHNTTSVGSLITGLDSIATVLDNQRYQMQTTLDLAAEYLRTFNGSRQFIFDLAQQLQMVESTYYTYRDGFNRTYQMLGDVLIRIGPFEKYYLGHKEQLRNAVNQAREAIASFQQSLGPVLGQLNAFHSQLDSWLGPDGLETLGGGQISASQICIPIAGRNC